MPKKFYPSPLIASDLQEWGFAALATRLELCEWRVIQPPPTIGPFLAWAQRWIYFEVRAPFYAYNSKDYLLDAHHVAVPGRDPA